MKKQLCDKLLALKGESNAWKAFINWLFNNFWIETISQEKIDKKLLDSFQ
jgi:hypothetical protein